MHASRPNLVLRSRVFYFRRAIPRDLRARFAQRELSISLRTSDTALAKVWSRELYVASERLFAQARRNAMLTSDQIATIIQDFYQYVLDQESHARLSAGPISEERRAGRAGYYKDLAEKSRRALAVNDLSGVHLLTTAMLQRHGLSRSVDATERRQVQQAILRAGIDLAEAMHARFIGDFNYEPRDRLLKHKVEKAVHATAGAVREASPPNEAPAADAPAGSRHSPTPPTVSGRLFAVVAADFVSKQTKLKRWERQTALQNEKSYTLFAQIAGDRPLTSYTRRDAAKFKDVLERLPADYGKAACFSGRTPGEILEIDAARSSAFERLSTRTVKRHISALSSLWDENIPKEEAKENIFTGFKFPHQQRAQDQRPMWSRADLARLFQTPVWAGCKSESRRSTPGPRIIRDEKFWLPLIAVFSGARQEEICQLRVEDVRQEDGIWVLDINDRPPRRLKNRTAVRLIPLHRELIALGFLDQVGAARTAGTERVFPNLEPGGADGRLGHAYTKWFTRYRRDVGLYLEGKDFHSFRHSATTFLHQAGVSNTLIDRLTGHTTPGETARYTKASTMRQLADAIDAIDIGLPLHKLYPT